MPVHPRWNSFDELGGIVASIQDVPAGAVLRLTTVVALACERWQAGGASHGRAAFERIRTASTAGGFDAQFLRGPAHGDPALGFALVNCVHVLEHAGMRHSGALTVAAEVLRRAGLRPDKRHGKALQRSGDPALPGSRDRDSLRRQYRRAAASLAPRALAELDLLSLYFDGAHAVSFPLKRDA